MIGKLINGKIVYHTPTHRFLSNGDWKKGWSESRKTSGDKMEYDYISDGVEMIEGYRYKFELENYVAKIIRKAR